MMHHQHRPKTLLCVIATSVILLLTSPVAAAPQRIISLAPHLTEWVYALGAGHQLIAVSEASDYPPQAKQLPVVANYQGLDVEQIIKSHPDLVLVWRSGNRAPDVERLRQFGIPLFYSDPKRPADISRELLLLGKKLGHTQQARTLAQQFTQQLAALRRRYQQRPLIPVFYELWPRPLTTANGDSWIGHLLTLCHVENVFADSAAPYPQVTVEQVLHHYPQAILMAGQEVQTSQQQWQQWPQLPAVKNKALLPVDAHRLHRFTPRLLPALTEMCQQLDAIRPD